MIEEYANGNIDGVLMFLRYSYNVTVCNYYIFELYLRVISHMTNSPPPVSHARISDLESLHNINFW